MLLQKLIVRSVRFYCQYLPFKFGKRFLIKRAQGFIPSGENKLRILIQGQLVNFVIKSPEDCFYSELFFTNHLEEGTSLFFASFLKDTDVIFDIGTNLGFMSLQFACISKRGVVYSFEPMPLTFQKLCKNISLNPSLSNRINIMNKAVSDYNGPLSLYVPNDGHHGLVSISDKISNDVRLVTVQACTIDTFVSDNNIKKIDFIKIDVEGAEGLVIKGAMNSIAKFNPSVMLEANVGVHSDKGILIDLIEEICSLHDYRLFRAPSAYLRVVGMMNSGDFCNGDNIFILNEEHARKILF